MWIVKLVTWGRVILLSRYSRLSGSMKLGPGYTSLATFESSDIFGRHLVITYKVLQLQNRTGLVKEKSTIKGRCLQAIRRAKTVSRVRIGLFLPWSHGNFPRHSWRSFYRACALGFIFHDGMRDWQNVAYFGPFQVTVTEWKVSATALAPLVLHHGRGNLTGREVFRASTLDLLLSFSPAQPQ